ncbi:uncharacterized protein [Rutidosis leptorrhynchoides]|uniref:uncharacterized protein n=1 Tax=Rutidosis leptorrhynchoides TaxID=125765 RepID=UPI003A9A12BF
MDKTFKMLEFLVDDSDDEKIVSFVNGLTHEEVDGEASSSRVPRSRIYIARDRGDAAIRLYNDYFSESPMFPDKYFKRHFRMSRELFLRIIEVFAKPTAEDIVRLYNFHAQKHGLPGHYARGDQKEPFVMLEAVAPQDLWIWHAFFGMAGSNNDINVLNFSPLFNTIKDGTAPPSPFEVNGRRYERGYYLGDARTIDFNKIRRHMYACIVLHNIIQENNGFVIGRREERVIQRNPPRQLEWNLRDRDARIKEIRDRQVYKQLEADLTEHVWNLSPYFRTVNDK